MSIELELKEEEKPSTCYGCGQVLKTFNMLICAECLNGECEQFVKLVTGKPGRRKKK
ncbi:MAG TPA: hypothetical protein VI423_01765 [Paenisporosarcina sp.]|nr:hypothetical protein [Paenisporosarcina sp.]